MAKKVKLTLSGFAGVYDTQYTFHEGDGLDTVIRAYVDEDEEAMDEIDDCGGLDSYIIDLPVCNPDGLAGAGLSLNIINDLTLNEVTAVVDGEIVFSKNWSDDGEWLENIVEEKIASAMTREEDFRQPVFDLISEVKHEEIVAIRKMEGDHIDIYLEYEFEIEDEFDFNKFQFIKVIDEEGDEELLYEEALYDGKPIKGEDTGDHCQDHVDIYLSTFTADGEDLTELDSF